MGNGTKRNETTTKVTEVTNNQSWFMPSDQIVIKIQETINQSNQNIIIMNGNNFSFPENKSFFFK